MVVDLNTIHLFISVSVYIRGWIIQTVYQDWMVLNEQHMYSDFTITNVFRVN